MNKLLVSLIFISLSSAAVIFYGCKKSGGGQPFTLSGTVMDESGAPVASANVTIDNITLVTGAAGNFKFSMLSSGKSSFQLQVDAPGYFTQYKNVDNIDGSSLSIPIMLIQQNTLGTLNAGKGGTAGAVGLRVIAPANAFSASDGIAYSGIVSVSARYITKTNANIAQAMPGGDFMAVDNNGKTGGMRTYGFVATQFMDNNGNPLTPNANVKVAVTLPGGVSNPQSDGAQAWSFDKTSGKWNNGVPITVSQGEYYMPCTTLYQNIDKFISFGTLEGKVVCSGGSPASFVTITLQSDNDEYITTTNADGRFSANVEATNTYTISASGGNSVTVSYVLANTTTTVNGLTVAQCTDNNGSGGSGTGKWTFNGATYGSLCASVPDVNGCNGIDVAIADRSGAAFNIYNMPTGNSGSYPFTDFYFSGSLCSLFGLNSYANGTQYGTQSGTITKTGAKSFTFSCTVYDLTTNKTYSVSGSGNY